MLVLSVCFLALVNCKSSEKTTKPNNQSAIIAIQIIDPNEEKTGKGSKRTIESSLGYGYQSSPKYEVYKYSQNDIPPYKGPTIQSNGGINFQAPPIDNTIQQSQIQGGTVLFSSIDQHGQLGKLSPQLPDTVHNQQFPIPVIILRVHPNQLSNPLYPNLPSSHLHASSINSVDITSLLSNYIGSTLKDGGATTNYQPAYQTNNNYYVPNHVEYQTQDYQAQQSVGEINQQAYPYQYEEQVQQNYDYQDVQQQEQSKIQDVQYVNYQQPQAYQQPADYSPTELLTHENYPSEKHTQIIFNTGKGKQRHAKDPYKVRVKYVKSQVPEESQHQTQSKPTSSHYKNSDVQYQYQYSDDNQQYSYNSAPQYEETEERQSPDRYQNVYVQKSRQVYLPNQEQSQHKSKVP